MGGPGGVGRASAAARRGLLAGLALCGGASWAPCQEAPQPRRGPIESREEWLLAEGRLTLPAVSPEPLRPGETRLRLALDWGNDFGWQQTFAGEVPGDRGFLVDGEHRTLDLDARRGLRPGLDVGVRVPLRWRGGGNLDGIIDAFHRFTRHLGLPENGRPLFRRNQLRVAGRDDALEPVVWTGRAGTGLGRIELDTRWAFSRPARRERWRAALVGRVSLPTGTGAFDGRGLGLGLQLVAARSLRRSLDLYLGAGGAFCGEADAEGIDYERLRAHGFAVVEWRAFSSWSFLVETDAASRLVTNLAAYPALESYLRIGAKVDLGRRWGLEGGFAENIADQQATTDFGIFLGLTRRF